MTQIWWLNKFLVLGTPNPLMAAYRRAVDNIAGHFKGYQVDHLDRRKNEAMDALSWLGS